MMQALITRGKRFVSTATAADQGHFISTMPVLKYTHT